MHVNVNESDKGDGVDLSDLIENINIDIPLADSETVGGMKALSYSEGSGNSIYTDAVNAFGQWLEGPSSGFNMGYSSDEESGVTVFPLIVDSSQGYGLIAIPNDLFGDGTGGGGTKVVANPGGDPEESLTTIKIGETDYKIVGGNGVGLSNAFSRVIVGDTNIDASGSDSFSLVAGTNVTLIPNATNNTITINATGGDNTEPTYIENPYDDSWKDGALSRISAAENALREMHDWAEDEIEDVGAHAIEMYNELKGKIGHDQYWDEDE